MAKSAALAAGKETAGLLGRFAKWVLTTIGGIILFIVWMEVRSCVSLPGEGVKPVEPGDRAVMVSAQDLSSWFGGLEIDAAGDEDAYEKWAYEGITEVQYSRGEYDEEYGETVFSVDCQVSHTKDEAQARELLEEYRAELAGYEEWFDGEGVEDLSTQFSWGDESVLFVLDDGEGGEQTTFAARKGVRVYVLQVYGHAVESGSEVDLVLSSKLRAFETWEP